VRSSEKMFLEAKQFFCAWKFIVDNFWDVEKCSASLSEYSGLRTHIMFKVKGLRGKMGWIRISKR